MDYKDIIRIKPWLRLVNTASISKRLLDSTNNNAFIVYNMFTGNYELHTVQAEQMSGDSYNANIPQEVLNQWIIEDYNSTDFEKYVDDAMSDKQVSEFLNSDEQENKRRQLELGYQLETIERVFGTKL